MVPAANVFNTSKGFCIGARYNGGNIDSRFTGYIDELRISTGTRYSGVSFTPPTTQFTTDGTTVILNRMESLFLTDSQVTPTPTAVSGLDVTNAGAVTSNKGYKATYGNIEASAEDATLKLSGSTVLSSSTLGSGVTGASLSSITPSGGTLAVTGAMTCTGQVTCASYLFGTGIYFRAYRVGTWTVVSDESILIGGAANFDNTNGVNGFSSSLGRYVAPRSGVYRLSLFVRVSDTSATVGIKPSRVGIAFSIQTGDNTYWLPNDGSTRRTGSFTENVYLSVGNGYHFTSYGTMTMAEFIFSGEYLGA